MNSPSRSNMRDIREGVGRGVVWGGYGGDMDQVSDPYRRRRQLHSCLTGICLL